MRNNPRIDVPKMFQLWGGPLSNEELARTLGVTRGKLSSLRVQYGLPLRKHVRTPRTGVSAPDPTEEEIEARAAEVRAGWSKDQEERRWLGGPRSAVAPNYVPRFSSRGTSFSSMDV